MQLFAVILSASWTRGVVDVLKVSRKLKLNSKNGTPVLSPFSLCSHIYLCFLKLVHQFKKLYCNSFKVAIA